jgi:putative sigma-54 modulation protein
MMRIQFRKRNIAMTVALRSQVRRKLGLALGRYGARIEKVIVRLSDGDVHREKAERQCEIEVGMRTQTVSAQDRDADLFIAVDRAASRVSRSIARALETERERNGGTPGLWPFGRPRAT